jgi:hypothetical protein
MQLSSTPSHILGLHHTLSKGSSQMLAGAFTDLTEHTMVHFRLRPYLASSIFCISRKDFAELTAPQDDRDQLYGMEPMGFDSVSFGELMQQFCHIQVLGTWLVERKSRGKPVRTLVIHNQSVKDILRDSSSRKFVLSSVKQVVWL